MGNNDRNKNLKNLRKIIKNNKKIYKKTKENQPRVRSKSGCRKNKLPRSKASS